MKFSGANFLMALPRAFRRSKSNTIALTIVLLLLAAAFFYFRESNRVRLKEYSVEQSQTLDGFVFDTISVQIVHNYAGDFKLNEVQLPANIGEFDSYLQVRYVYTKLRDTTECLTRKLLSGDEVIVRKDTEDASGKPEWMDVWNEIRQQTYIHKNLPDYAPSSRTPRVKRELIVREGVACLRTRNYRDGVESFEDAEMSLAMAYGGERWSASWSRDTLQMSMSTILKNSMWGPRFFNINQSSICIKGLKLLPAKYTEVKVQYRTAMAFDALYPEPDRRTATSVIYNTPEKIALVSTEGAYVHARSLSNESRYEMGNFVLATVIGFLLSLVVELIYRIAAQNALERRKEEESKRQQESDEPTK